MQDALIVAAPVRARFALAAHPNNLNSATFAAADNA
jgi:hypothetical protein